MHTRRTSRNLKVCHRVAFVLLLLFTLLAASSQSLAGNRMYDASWIAESFGNDNVNIGTGNSPYFEVYAVPWGNQGHSLNPLCDISSTPVTTAGVGTAWGLPAVPAAGRSRLEKCPAPRSMGRSHPSAVHAQAHRS